MKEAPKFILEPIRTISHPTQRYLGWPSIARTASGDLLVVASGNREGHVCPYGQIHLIRSRDGGESWEPEQVLADTPLDDRDCGVLVTSKGTILVSWFNSRAWIERLKLVESVEEYLSPESREQYEQYKALRDELSEETINEHLGFWIIRSEDDGKTWSDPVSSVVNSPHGPIELSDGRLLSVGRYRMKDQHAGHRGVGAAESRDDGRTWELIGDIPTRAGDDSSLYHEIHQAEAAPGHIVAHIRNHNKPQAAYSNVTWKNKLIHTLQSESRDGGKTWSEPIDIGISGYPCHLIRLEDGRLMTTYGVRREPYGVHASFSSDQGRSWSEPVRIMSEGAPRDLGYPASVEVSPKKFVTVWYEQLPEGTYDGPEDWEPEPGTLSMNHCITFARRRELGEKGMSDPRKVTHGPAVIRMCRWSLD